MPITYVPGVQAHRVCECKRHSAVAENARKKSPDTSLHALLHNSFLRRAVLPSSRPALPLPFQQEATFWTACELLGAAAEVPLAAMMPEIIQSSLKPAARKACLRTRVDYATSCFPKNTESTHNNTATARVMATPLSITWKFGLEQ